MFSFIPSAPPSITLPPPAKQKQPEETTIQINGGVSLVATSISPTLYAHAASKAAAVSHPSHTSSRSASRTPSVNSRIAMYFCRCCETAMEEPFARCYEYGNVSFYCSRACAGTHSNIKSVMNTIKKNEVVKQIESGKGKDEKKVT